MPGVETFIAGIATSLGASAATAATIGTVATRLMASVALSALSAALAPDADQPDPPGIKTDFTQTGGTNFASFILGRTASDGTHVCPPMTHGTAGDIPNAYLTYVIELSDLPGCTLEKIFVDGRAIGMSGSTGTYGRNASDSRYQNRVWWKYYDGSQTAADSMLLSKYGSYPERPWKSDMVGQGICYAILTFRYDRELFSGFPQVRFEMKGVPLYDPRKDSTAGGSGAHRWNDPSTWEQSENFAVQAYNIHRGIDLGGPVWGGDMGAEALPLDSWMAQMNICDADIDGSPQYRTGMEITVDRTPADVSEELARGASAEFAELGGVFKLRCGAPAMPVFFLTDDDLMLDRESRLQLIPDTRIRAVSATYPDPATMWEPREAPLRTDGGAVLPSEIAGLDLAPVPYPAQVQRLQLAYLEDQQRRRVLTAPLPPDASLLEPLDVVSYSSDVHGFIDKEFEVRSLNVDRATGVTIVSLREKDASDYDWEPSDEIPDDAPSWVPVDADAVTLPGFAASAEIIADGLGADRRPGIRLSWSAGLTGVRAVAWEVRLDGGPVVSRGSDDAPDENSLILSAGLLPAQNYQVRARPIMNRLTLWTAWAPVQTDDVRIGTPDLHDSINQAIADGAQAASDLVDLRGDYSGTLPDIVDDMQNVSLVAARLSSGGLLVNPAFIGWGGTWPDGWRIAADAGEAFAKVIGGEYGHAVDLFADPAATSNNGPILNAFSGQDGNRGVPASLVERVLVTLEVELLYGTWSGAHIAVAWIGDQLVLGQVPLDQGRLTETIGVRQRVQVFVDRPETFVAGGADEIKLDLVANSATGGGYADKGVRVHFFDVEAINAESLAGIIQQVQVRQDLQSSLLALQAVAGEAEGTVQIVAQDDGEAPYSRVIIDSTFFELRGNALFGDDVEITGDLIVDGAVSRKVFYSKFNTTTITGSGSGNAQPISDVMSVDFVPHDDFVNPSNREMLTISGSITNNQSGKAWVYIGLEARTTGGGWYNLSSNFTGYIFLLGSQTKDFSVRAMWRPSGQEPALFDEFRSIAWIITPTGYTSTSVTFGQLTLTSLEQVNK